MDDRHPHQLQPDRILCSQLNPVAIPKLWTVFVEFATPSQKLTLVGRHFKFIKYGVHGANWLAVGTIDAYFCIDEIHIFSIGRRDAADGADFQARGVLNSDAGFGDYETQNIPLSPKDELLRRLFGLFKDRLFSSETAQQKSLYRVRYITYDNPCFI